MISVLLSKLVLLTFGTLYPAYASYKTVKTKNVREYVRWMTYWIVFAIYTLIEIFADIFISFWFPFYYELKILIIFWLICPATRGSTYLFRKVINPYLSKHEVMLDSYIDSLWDQGYDIARNIGAQGISYVGHLMLEFIQKAHASAFENLYGRSPKSAMIPLPKAAKSPPKAVIQQSPLKAMTQQSRTDALIECAHEEFEMHERAFLEMMKENMDSHIMEDEIDLVNHYSNEEASNQKSSSEEDEEWVPVRKQPLRSATKAKGKSVAARGRRKKNAA